MKRTAARLLLSAALCFTAHAKAQTDAPPTQHEPLAGPDAQDGRRNETRAFIESRLEQIAQERAALERALEDLDAGREVDWPAGSRERRGFGHRFRDREGGAPGGPGGPGEPREPREPLTDEQRTRVMGFLREHDPRMLERFDQMSARNPEFAERMLQRFGHRTLRMIELQNEDPDEFARRLDAMKAQGNIRETVTEAVKNGTLDTPETREKLTAMVTARLDLQESEHEDEIDRLADRIAHLRERQASDREERSERIDRMVNRIMDKAAEFGEHPPPPPR